MTHRHADRSERSTTRKVIVTGLIAAAATLAFVALAWAVDGDSGRDGYYRGPEAGMHGGPMMGAGRGGRFMLRALDRHLDLTDEQRTSIEQIIDASRAEGEALRVEMHALFEQVRNQVQQEGFDEDRVRIIIENQAPRMVDMMVLRIRTMAEIREQLAPEQQATMQELFESRRGRFMR